jgi:hypothetical protein
MTETPSTSGLCGYPVEKTIACNEVNTSVHVLHAAQPPWKPKIMDTIRHHFDEKGADKISHQYQESL